MTDHPARAVIAAADTVTAKIVEAEKLRQAVEEIRALHSPIHIGVLPGDAFDVCAECCYADDVDRIDGRRSNDCYDWHHHGDPHPICPTAAIIDRLGL